MRYNNSVMAIFLYLTIIILFVLLIIVAAMRPVRSQLSLFELKRRVLSGDLGAKKALDREEMLVDIISMQQIVVSLLLVVVVLLCVVKFGWLVGLFIGLLVVLGYGAIARIKFIYRISQIIYARIDKALLKFIKKVPFIFKLLRSVSDSDILSVQRINSREELQYLIDRSVNALTNDEKKLIVYGLSFSDKLVESIMTPRSKIDSIDKSEFLGPLVLDDLHKTGHSRLPVISGDVNHVVGILNLKDLLTLSVKKSMTAEKAMNPKVYYIRSDQTLRQALTAFLRTKTHLFVVVDKTRETVGLLALEDVIEALIGQKIIDDFDADGDLRAVALRSLSENDASKKKQNV